MRVLTKELARAAREGREITMQGWVHRLRELGGICFVILRDRSGLSQIVFEQKPDLSLESVVEVQGIPALNAKAPGGAELRATSFRCLSKAAPDLPYQVNGDPSKVGLEALLDHRGLSLRHPRLQAVFKIQSTIIEAFGAYLRSHDFVEIKTSKLVCGGTEGGAELFAVDYFDRTVYLAQSPQFYKETMVASGMERVFEIAPAYRAEKHDSPRHLNEYVSMDVEMGFIESENELIELERGLLSHIFEEVARKNSADLALHNVEAPDPAVPGRAPVVPYEEAVRLASAEAVKARGSAARIFDLNPEAERFICAWAMREHGADLVFVTEFPRRHRPFYTYPKDSAVGQSASTMSFDALFRGLEITTGGKRQHDYNAFLETLPRFGLKPESLSNYLALLKYGCPPHGGFAVGCERLTQKILGLANVKEASLFPRDRKRVEP